MAAAEPSAADLSTWRRVERVGAGKRDWVIVFLQGGPLSGPHERRRVFGFLAWPKHTLIAKTGLAVRRALSSGLPAAAGDHGVLPQGLSDSAARRAVHGAHLFGNRAFLEHGIGIIAVGQ